MRQAELKQSLGFVQFFTSLAGGVIIVWLVWNLSETPMASINERAQLESVRRSAEWTEILLNNLPLLFLLMAVVGSIAWVVFQTRFA